MTNTRPALYVLLLALLAGCAGQASTQAAATKAQASVGVVTMKADGTLVAQLRGESPGGLVAETMLVLKPDDPRYGDFVTHVGGLKPDEEKPIPPWPEQPR